MSGAFRESRSRSVLRRAIHSLSRLDGCHGHSRENWHWSRHGSEVLLKQPARTDAAGNLPPSMRIVGPLPIESTAAICARNPTRKTIAHPPARSHARAENTAQSDASEPATAKTNQP